MAPAVDQVYDDETQSSDWANERSESPTAKRYCSEPAGILQGFKSHSIETSLSPPPSIHHQIKCPWCPKEFEAPEDGVASEYDVLKEHLALMHPQIADLAAHDFTGKDIDTDIAMDGNDEMNGHGSTLGTSNITTVTASATGVEVTPEANDNASEAVLMPDATEGLHSKLHGLKRQQAHEYTDKWLLASWKLHDVREFSADYDDTTADLEEKWRYVHDKPKATDEEATSSDIPTRLDPYLSTTTDKGEFLKLTPVETLLESLQGFESLPTDKIHAAAENVAHVLKAWQDEWQAIEKLTKEIGHRAMKKPANPRALDPPEVFEDRKEAILYDYKYDPTIHDPKKRDPKKAMFRTQDPFIQGGFRPTAAQLRKMQAEVKGNPNPDKFRTMEKYGQEYIPRYQEPPLNPNEDRGSTSRKRKAVQSELEALRQGSGHESTTPALESDIDGQPFKRVTRSVVSKSVDVPQTKTAPPSPGPRGRGRGTRGGRGRGGTLKTSRPAKTTLATKAIASKAAEKPIDSTISNGTEGTLSLSLTTVPHTDRLTPDQPSANTTGSANIAPAPKPALAPATPGAPPALASLPPNLVQPGEVVDAFELNRRRLLAKSKNPRRTQAMLDHWDRFNKEGRTRNPKRTKAQIEADKVADAERKANEPQKAPATKTRKRKAMNTDTTDEPVKKQSRTASMAAAVSIQPAPIQPAIIASTATIAPPPPPPPAITLPQPHHLQPAAPARARSPQSFLGPHTSAPPVVSQPQSARPIQPVLPGFDRNAGTPLWAPPPRYYPFASPAPPYHSYGQTQFPPPPVNPSHRHDAGPAEIIQQGPTYPFDAIRPLQHLQNGSQMQRP